MCTLILTGIAGFALSVFTAGKIVSTQARARLAPSPSVSIHSPRPNAVLSSNEGVTINGTAANLQYRQLWIFVLRAWHFYDPYVEIIQTLVVSRLMRWLPTRHAF